jgi:hypothetical protein
MIYPAPVPRPRARHPRRSRSRHRHRAHAIVTVAVWLKMKRSMDSATNSPIAPLVRLNVGGRIFDTTRDTLSKCQYFEAYLENRMGHGVDSNGRIFVDRCGELFAILLRFMRTGLRPALVNAQREALLEEANFFGIEWFAHRIRGEISPYDLRFEDRVIYENEMVNDVPLIDVFNVETIPLPREQIQQPLLFDTEQARPLIASDYATFRERLDAFTGGLLDSLEQTDNIIIAGGSVIGALMGVGAGDVDIFMSTSHGCETRLRHILSVVQQNQAERLGKKKSKILVIRSNAAVTMFRIRVGDDNVPPVQVILTTCNSVVEVIQNFDVDCCCFAFIPRTNRVVCTPRGLRALRYAVNIADNSRFDGRNYCRRLEKYARRGFAIAVPGFEPKHVHASLLSRGTFVFLHEYDILLKVEPKELHGKDMEIQTKHPDGSGVQNVNVEVGAVQRGQAILGFARLVIMDRKIANHVQLPRTSFCPHHLKTFAKHSSATGTCIPIVVDSGHYMLLWGAGKDDKETQSDDDDEYYTETPLASAYTLLEKHFNRELEANTHEEDEGGIMEKLSGGMTRPSCQRVQTTLHNTTASRLMRKSHLLYVYDFLPCDGSFEDLKFVRNAGRHPLKIMSGEDFKKAYGIHRELRFVSRARSLISTTDWWSVVYEETK